MDAGRQQSSIQAGRGQDLYEVLPVGDDSGVAVHTGRAPSIAFMVEATERRPRAPAPGLRLLIVTAATRPVRNTVAMAATSSSMLTPSADGVDALGTNRGSSTSRSTWR